MQKGIELRQIGRRHDDLRRGRQGRVCPGERDHRDGGQRLRVREQDSQRIIDRDFTVMGRMVQNLQIFLGARPFVTAFAKPIVGQTEARGRKQVLTIDIVGERARLPHQLVDDMSIVNGVFVPADQARPRLHMMIRVPDLDAIGIQPGFDPFADEPARHRISVAMNVNQTAGVDLAGHLQTTVEPLIGQCPERRRLFGQAVAPAGVAGLHHLLQEHHILVAAGEVAAAAQEQRLIHGRLEMPVRRFTVAVLVRLSDVDALTIHAVVREQVAIARLKLTRHRQIIHRRGQAVAAMAPRRTAEFPERFLQTVGQGLERLRRANIHRLPVRVGQHEVVHQVIERLPRDGDAQVVHVGEVRRPEIPGLMDLPEHDRAVRPGQGAPLTHPPLESPAMRVEKRPRMFPAQPVEQCLCQQPRLGPQPLFHGRPHIGKGIDPGPIGARLFALARQRRIVAVETRRFVGHACPPGRPGQ